ncbi:hypothetical protein AAE02nite_42740 [Adhaeribacter aerolatus]|uniref:Uncharacterized protein n=1 Tax=Adhaeribacter aerolatus TaxID=670289 RepID=A0A512B3S6_9BACT|nr:hypothetical protein [Adhaeribacter aerolatus]GEO06610.1 hypothetical protein AAE02nite_42740 [Adhaeribacter aerolatus]
MRNPFKHNSSLRKTGVYKLIGNSLVEFEELPGNGSINAVVKDLGFGLSQIKTIFTFNSKTLDCIGVKIFTKQVVFASLRKDITALSLTSLNNELKRIDWEYEYSSHAIEEILNTGIEENNLTFDYLSSVTELIKESPTLFLAPSLKLYLSFENNLLIGFSSSEWNSTEAKWLKNLNEKLYSIMVSEATNHHDNELDAMEEVNIQCQAIRNIPNAMKNIHIPMHSKPNGTYNFYNLLAAHYNRKNTSIDEFKFINKGRFIELYPNELQVGNFIYKFSTVGMLDEVFLRESSD